MLWHIFPFLLYQLLFHSTTASNRTSANADYIDTAVNAISTVSSGSADVLMSLNLLSPQTALLLKVVVPVGSIIVADLNPEAESDVFKELMDLKTRTAEIWRLNERAIETSVRVLGQKIASNQYFEHVTHPINVMKQLVAEYIDPTVFKPRSFVNGFVQNCRFGANAPDVVLTYLIGRLVTPCNEPTSEAAKMVANQRAYLINVAQRLNVSGGGIPDDIGIYLKEFLPIYERASDKSIFVLEELDVFSHPFSTFKKAFRAFFDEVRCRGKIPENVFGLDDCYLRDIINGTNFSYDYAEAFALQLREQLIDLSYFAGICANVSFDGREESMYKYINLVAGKITLVSTHTANWLNKALESAWPSIHQEILYEQIVRVLPGPGIVTRDNLAVVIRLTQSMLETTGSPGFVYQALIAKMVEDREHFFEGIDSYCVIQKKFYGGFDAVLNRVPLNSTNEQDKERVHARMVDMNNYATTLNDTIQSAMNQLYNAGDIATIIAELKKKLGMNTVVEEKKFHCFSVLRGYADWPWEPCPTIESTAGLYRYGDLIGGTTIGYQNSGHTTEDCKIFRFTFFV